MLPCIDIKYFLFSWTECFITLILFCFLYLLQSCFYIYFIDFLNFGETVFISSECFYQSHFYSVDLLLCFIVVSDEHNAEKHRGLCLSVCGLYVLLNRGAAVVYHADVNWILKWWSWTVELKSFHTKHGFSSE